MTQYEIRLQQDLEALRTAVVDLATDVRANLADAVKALLANDSDLAYRTILKDSPVNRNTEAVEALGHRFVARHLPSAGHLRFVSAVFRIAILLERLGDYAVTICREAVQLKEPLAGSFRDEVRTMSQDSLQMLDQAIRAFDERDHSLARGTMGFAEQVDRDFAVAFNMLLHGGMTTLPAQDVFGRLIIIMQLERVSDQAKNLCEETVFALTGETKIRRPVRVLFVDTTDDGSTQMAVAIGNKHFPTKGIFSSVGLQPATAVRDDVRTFMEAHGYDLANASPTGITFPPDAWTDFDVVVSLSGPVTSFLKPIPFHTVALSWAPPPEVETLEDRYRYLSAAVGDLIETLRGTDAVH